MKCINKSEAQRVAYFGFKKMGNLYVLRPGVFNSTYTVATATGDRVYFVRVNNRYGRPDHCSCSFFENNESFGVCKHIYYAKDEIAYEAQREIDIDERVAAMQDMADDQAGTEADKAFRAARM